MANVVNLHKRQAYLTNGAPAEYAKLYLYLSGTTAQVQAYADADLTTPRSQPIMANAAGVFPPCYVALADPLRHRITDQYDVNLPGYPQDDITPEPIELQGAGDVAFSPTEAVPATDVQAAIEYVADQITDQSDTFNRAFVPWVTTGTGNAYSITPEPALTSYVDGTPLTVRLNRTNTGPATLNVNALGARALQKTNASGTPVDFTAGELQAGREIVAVFDGVRFLVTIGRDLPVRTVAEDGSYSLRWADGTQECVGPTHTLDIVTGGGGGNLAGTITFPTPFIAASYYFSASLRPKVDGASTSTDTIGEVAGLTVDQIGAILHFNRFTSSVAVLVNKIGGDFAEGDKMYINWVAKGRWL